MKVNLKGITRIVLELDEVVIKIPNFTCQWNHFLKGLIANMEEDKTWKYNSGKYEKGHSHLLCPVLFCSWGGWFLIMKKAIVCDSESQIDCTEHIKYFKGDDKPHNYGMIAKNLVKIDYGDLDYYWGEDFKNGNNEKRS